MVKVQSILRIVDNSGGKRAKCIKILGKSSNSNAFVGDVVIVSIKSLRPRYRSQVRVRVNKTEIYKGVIVQTRRFSKHKDGRLLFFNNNSVVLITTQGKPLGTRVLTFLPRILRGLGWSKIITLSKGFI